MLPLILLTVDSTGLLAALRKVLEAKLVILRSSWGTGWIRLVGAHQSQSQIERVRGGGGG